jgi:hypothetical protein
VVVGLLVAGLLAAGVALVLILVPARRVVQEQRAAAALPPR